MRLLCHLSFSLTLDDYYRRADDESDTMAAAIGKSIERGDRGFADFWWRTCEGACHMLPSTRLGQAYYLTTDAVKLRYRGRLSINPSGTYHGSDTGSGLEGESVPEMFISLHAVRGKRHKTQHSWARGMGLLSLVSYRHMRAESDLCRGISQEREKDRTEQSRISLVHSESVGAITLTGCH